MGEFAGTGGFTALTISFLPVGFSGWDDTGPPLVQNFWTGFTKTVEF